MESNFSVLELRGYIFSILSILQQSLMTNFFFLGVLRRLNVTYVDLRNFKQSNIYNKFLT